MPALTNNFNAMERHISLRKFPIKDGEIMYAGGIGAVNITTGEAEMVSDSANLVVGGRVESYVDNTNDGLSVNLKVGCFRWNNSETHAVTAADLNKIVYIEDDNTIANDPGNNAVIAGVLVEIESAGVWVDNSPAAIAAALGIVMPKAANVADPDALTYSSPATLTSPAAGGGSGADATTFTGAQCDAPRADVAAIRDALIAAGVDLGVVRASPVAIIDALQAAGLMAAE